MVRDASTSDGFAHFSVSDNGIGIDPRYAERVFDVFQRLHERDAYPGTGLGLSLCKKIVERHGGRIAVEPNAGPGTRIRFSWPTGEAALPDGGE